jgi:hypothetical protein
VHPPRRTTRLINEEIDSTTACRNGGRARRSYLFGPPGSRANPGRRLANRNVSVSCHAFFAVDLPNQFLRGRVVDGLDRLEAARSPVKNPDWHRMLNSTSHPPARRGCASYRWIMDHRLVSIEALSLTIPCLLFNKTKLRIKRRRTAVGAKPRLGSGARRISFREDDPRSPYRYSIRTNGFFRLVSCAEFQQIRSIGSGAAQRID